VFRQASQAKPGGLSSSTFKRSPSPQFKVKGHPVGGRNFLGPGPPYCKATTPQLNRKTPFTGESGQKSPKNVPSPIGLLHGTHRKKIRQKSISGGIWPKKFRGVQGPLAPQLANFQLIRRTLPVAIMKKPRNLPFFGGPISRVPPGESRCASLSDNKFIGDNFWCDHGDRCSPFTPDICSFFYPPTKFPKILKNSRGFPF
jgi:hypothetical protein